MTYREPHWYQRLVWEMDAQRDTEERAAGERVRLALLKPGQCGHAASPELHICPYKSEIELDDSLCDCCETCCKECAQSI